MRCVGERVDGMFKTEQTEDCVLTQLHGWLWESYFTKQRIIHVCIVEAFVQLVARRRLSSIQGSESSG